MNVRAEYPDCPSFAKLLLVCLAALALPTTGCGGSEEPVGQQPVAPAKAAPSVEKEPEPEPEPKPISLAMLEPVTLDPGETVAVAVRAERSGNEGPIRVEVKDLPDGITVSPIEIPAEQSAGQLEVAAAEALGDNVLKVSFAVTATLGDLEARQQLAVTVNKLNFPSFQPATGVILQPGTSATVDLAINRNGFEGPVRLSVEGLPAKVTGKMQQIAADQNGTKLELAAAGDAADGEHTVRVATTLFGRSFNVQVPVQVQALPYRIDCFKIITLKLGEKTLVKIPIERNSYDGPLSLEVINLPEGVSVPKLDIVAGQTDALFEFTAAEDARECVRSAALVSKGGHLGRTDKMVVRVTHGGQGFLPRAITASDEMMHLLRRGSFGGRLTTETKQALVDAYGGTPESEKAVLLGLKWLAAHQQANGHWSLDYSEGIEGCDCKNAYENENEVDEADSAATAFGVLPFLGAGVTHNRAPKEPAELAGYRQLVEDGLAALAKMQVRDRGSPNDGHLGGSMYAHALGTMALCEGYGLSGDEDLKIPAQLAVKYMKEAQHTEGGWRYSRGQAGDMSVTAWVFLAIRSGQLAGLTIDRAPLVRAARFVDSCAVGPEEAKLARYAYLPEESPRLALSAAGLLTRQFLGWRKDNPDLEAGCQYLMQNLPPTSGNLGAIYYYHYATQVLHHMEGSDFDLWNLRMREHLIRTQEKEGHRAGSWNPQGCDHGARGGRMYATAMALLTLQVYYRHLPMYRPVKRVQGQDVRVQ